MLLAQVDWNQFWSAFFGCLIVALPTLITVYYRAVKIEDRVNDVHKEMNSMKDALVQVTGESEFAKGKIVGAEEQQRKQSDL